MRRAEPHGDVDVFEGSDAAFGEEDRLDDVRHEQPVRRERCVRPVREVESGRGVPVDDKPGRINAFDGCLAHRRGEAHRAREDGGVSMFRADNLDELHELRRVEEVHPDHLRTRDG